jgi:hypothetical protein
MPTYETPEPITVHLDLSYICANIQVVAADRDDSTVDIQPVDPKSKADQRIVEQTRVEYADGRLTVRAPKLGTLFGRNGAIDVLLALPLRSQLNVDTGVGEVRCVGQLGECRLKTGLGAIRVDRAAGARLRSGSGDITVEQVDGAADIVASSGAINVGRVDGPATVKNSNGESWIGEVTGEAKLNGANGSIAVDRALSDITAKTANGRVRVGEVSRGAVALETATGSVEVGIREGTAAWLDLNTVSGRIRNELSTAAGPDSSDGTVEVRARTYVGDIVVRRT